MRARPRCSDDDYFLEAFYDADVNVDGYDISLAADRNNHVTAAYGSASIVHGNNNNDNVAFYSSNLTVNGYDTCCFCRLLGVLDEQPRSLTSHICTFHAAVIPTPISPSYTTRARGLTGIATPWPTHNMDPTFSSTGKAGSDGNWDNVATVDSSLIISGYDITYLLVWVA
eukprot:scaffold7547_cov928-Prasinococcus_capsulatus_cf.AAC.1